MQQTKIKNYFHCGNKYKLQKDTNNYDAATEQVHGKDAISSGSFVIRRHYQDYNEEEGEVIMEDEQYGEESVDYVQDEEVEDDIQDEDVAIHFLQPAGNTVRYGEWKRLCPNSRIHNSTCYIWFVHRLISINS